MICSPVPLEHRKFIECQLYVALERTGNAACHSILSPASSAENRRLNDFGQTQSFYCMAHIPLRYGQGT